MIEGESWWSIFYLLLTGGIIAGFIEIGYMALTRWRDHELDAEIRKRQEFLDIARLKLEKIDKYSKDYLAVAGRAKALSSGIILSETLDSMPRQIVNRANMDRNEFQYGLCKFLYSRRTFVDNIGAYVFGSNMAEKAIADLEGQIFNIIDPLLPNQDQSRFANAIRDNYTYAEFLQCISDGNAYCDIKMSLDQWFNQISDHELVQLKQIMRWYYELIMFEIDSVYELWYNRQPMKSELPDKLVSYLEERYPKYFDRHKISR